MTTTIITRTTSTPLVHQLTDQIEFADVVVLNKVSGASQAFADGRLITATIRW